MAYDFIVLAYFIMQSPNFVITTLSTTIYYMLWNQLPFMWRQKRAMILSLMYFRDYMTQPMWN